MYLKKINTHLRDILFIYPQAVLNVHGFSPLEKSGALQPKGWEPQLQSGCRRGSERKEQWKLDQWEYRDRGGQQGGEGSKANKSTWLEGSQTDQLPPPAEK